MVEILRFQSTKKEGRKHREGRMPTLFYTGLGCVSLWHPITSHKDKRRLRLKAKLQDPQGPCAQLREGGVWVLTFSPGFLIFPF